MLVARSSTLHLPSAPPPAGCFRDGGVGAGGATDMAGVLRSGARNAPPLPRSSTQIRWHIASATTVFPEAIDLRPWR